MDLVKALRPFEVAITFLSYEENASISCILPVIFGLLESLKECSGHDSAAIREFERVMNVELKRRWELDTLDTSSYPVLAALLDPRFKQLKFLVESEIEFVKSELTERMANFNDHNLSSSGDEPQAKRQKTALDLLLGEQETPAHNSTAEELNQYMAEKQVPRKSSPLSWWKENEHKYPRLSKVTQEILGIPATSTPSERIFSTAGLTVTKLRNSIKPSNVDALICHNICNHGTVYYCISDVCYYIVVCSACSLF